MTSWPRYPRTTLTDDENEWLEEARTEPVVNTHICGNCRTPWGRSSVPCKNDTGTEHR